MHGRDDIFAVTYETQTGVILAPPDYHRLVLKDAYRSHFLSTPSIAPGGQEKSLNIQPPANDVCCDVSAT